MPGLTWDGGFNFPSPLRRIRAGALNSFLINCSILFAFQIDINGAWWRKLLFLCHLSPTSITKFYRPVRVLASKLQSKNCSCLFFFFKNDFCQWKAERKMNYLLQWILMLLDQWVFFQKQECHIEKKGKKLPNIIYARIAFQRDMECSSLDKWPKIRWKVSKFFSSTHFYDSMKIARD
jgi:hypothetical protein